MKLQVSTPCQMHLGLVLDIFPSDHGTFCMQLCTLNGI